MAIKEFRLPDPGEGLVEADIVTWCVAAGDQVKINDILVEIETSKSLVELPSPYEGTVTALLVSEGTPSTSAYRSSPSMTASRRPPRLQGRPRLPRSRAVNGSRTWSATDPSSPTAPAAPARARRAERKRRRRTSRSTALSRSVRRCPAGPTNASRCRQRTPSRTVARCRSRVQRRLRPRRRRPARCSPSRRYASWLAIWESTWLPSPEPAPVG